MKRFSIFVFAIVAVAQGIFAQPFSSVAPTGQTLYYDINIVQGTAKVVGPSFNSYGVGYSSRYPRPTGTLIIPDSVFYSGTTYPVTSIGGLAFDSCSGLVSVLIPNTVTSITQRAFNACSGLTSITIPASVKAIAAGIFCNCTGLTTVNFNADSCEYWNNPGYSSPFQGCTNIVRMNFGDNVQLIPNMLCAHLSGLTSVTIPNSVSRICGHAFIGCSMLDTVYLLPNVPPQVVSLHPGPTGPIAPDVSFPSTVSHFFVSCNIYVAYYCSYYWVGYREQLQILDGPNIAVGVSSNNGVFGTATVIQQYNQNISCDSVCIIGATSNYGYHFDHWSNGSTRNPDTIHLSRDSTIVAYFSPNQYSIVGVPNYSNRGYVSGCDTVDYLDTVVLTAVANHGYIFDHWSDGAHENPHSVVAIGDRTITAYFLPAQFSLSVVSADENMGIVYGGGSFDYQSNRMIRATANYGYHFAYWNDSDTNSTRIITLTQDTLFTAYFAPNRYTLSLQSADETLGIVNGGGVYNYHDTVTISATAIAPHYHFESWSDNSTDNPRQVVVSEDMTLTAYFSIDVYDVLLEVDSLIHGTVSGDGSYTYGTAATVTATPYSGWQFWRWSDGATYNPYTFAVIQDTVLTAYFVEEGTQIGIDGVDAMIVYVRVDNKQIVVEGADGNVVILYDAVGRVLATKHDDYSLLRFDVPAAGTYLIRIGNTPVRKIVVVR